ncbi:MAG: hypothetical protein FWF75_08630, partial [Propionibacteriaceae bacterium]|nr:hypothetical protein [Propionibacteriaceae bacterium]
MFWNASEASLLEGLCLPSESPPLADHGRACGVDSDAADLLQVSHDGVKVSVGLVGAKSSRLEKKGSTVTYVDAVDGGDLAYQVTSASVKESGVLKSAPKKAPVYTWRISGSGFTARQGIDGEIDTDTLASGTATSMSLCCDWADRLTSSTVTNPVAG